MKACTCTKYFEQISLLREKIGKKYLQVCIMATAKPSLKVRISFYTNSPLQILPLLTFKGDLLPIARNDKQHI